MHLSTDVVPAAQYLTEQTSDITIHTWDLARATGTEESLPDELVRAVWEYFEPQIEDLAATGLYAPRSTSPRTTRSRSACSPSQAAMPE